MGFDAQPVLRGDRVLLRPLDAGDFDALQRAAADPGIWAGHPARDRWQPGVFRPYFDFLLGAGGALVIIDSAADRVIGCSRYYTAPDMPGTIAIGFTFLARDCWGGAWNFEVKRLMLGHAFETYDEVWFHIDPTNMRSQMATERLGAKHVYDSVLDLSGVRAPWKCYRLTRADWAGTVARRHAATAQE